MKHLKTVFNALRGGLLALFLVISYPTFAQNQKLTNSQADPMDSVEISLLTCQPHDEVYSLYGHTAIRYHDMRKDGIDLAFNYGVFNFKAPYFVLRFVFGLTDYELGAYPYPIFLKEYQKFGSMVTEQVLNLTPEEKNQLRLALGENLLPGNNIYRYNYFYNNCTTKARDIIENCINGKVQYSDNRDVAKTYRESIHLMTRNNPWSKFGNDLLLGLKADFTTQQRQQQFLPNHLMYDFDHGQIYENGQFRPLVKESRIVVPAGVQITTQSFPLSPLTCGIILLVVGFAIFILEWRKQRAYRCWDLILMVTTGTLGIVLFLMLFSQHPTVNLNLQLLLINPLPWCFLWPVVKGRQTRYWSVTFVLFFLFMLGSLFQNYAEGLWTLALCLLFQSCIHLFKVQQT